MSDSPSATTQPPDKDGLVERALNRAVSMNAALARAHIDRFGGGKTGEALLKRLDHQYRLTVAGSSAAVGGAAVVPGVGTVASLALSGGQTVATLQATMLYVLSYAEATGVEVDDVDERRILLMTVLLGRGGTELVEKVLGNNSERWSEVLKKDASTGAVTSLRRQLQKRFLARFGITSIATSLARMLPFGAGAAVGGIAGLASSGAVIKTTRKAFGV